MLIAIATEIVARDQPKASSSGTIRTLGVARTPAADEQGEEVTPDDDPGIVEPAGGETRDACIGGLPGRMIPTGP